MGRLRTLLIALLVAVSAIAVPTVALAELLITPKRLVLDGTSRDAVFRLVNTGDKTETYELVWRQLRMNATGALLQVEENAPGSVNNLVQVAPSSVTLGPGERQTVRVVPRLPDGLPEGEYMSHLLFRPVGAPPVPDDPSAQQTQLQLAVRIGFSVPIILRNGQLSSTFSVRPTGIDTTAGNVTLEIDRAGSASGFGNIEIYWGKPGADGILVGRLDSVAIYANLTRRQVVVPLAPPTGIQVGHGLLLVRFIDPDTNTPLAESTVRLD